jgi:N-acetylglucosaminyldiphosphoundecaprenol N-acetyl-beta-D-mannosaminyltransferase
VIRQGEKVIGAYIDAIDWGSALAKISSWAETHQSRYVCICNVHSVVTTAMDRTYWRVVDEADMATPDGAPVAWMLRWLGYPNQKRINGPDLMLKYFTLAENRSESIFLYGGTQEALEKLQLRLKIVFPRLKIAGAYSPPFDALSDDEDEDIVQRINGSGAGTVWVSLGCPKQEFWMAQHRGRINAVMIGVGVAFDYHANTIARAPVWMQKNGLEWLHRLNAEPRRLWKRYLVTNSLFIGKATLQLVKRNVLDKRVR